MKVEEDPQDANNKEKREKEEDLKTVTSNKKINNRAPKLWLKQKEEISHRKGNKTSLNLHKCHNSNRVNHSCSVANKALGIKGRLPAQNF